MKEKVLEALKKVIYPGFSKDIVSYGFVKEVNEKEVIIEIPSQNVNIKEEVLAKTKEALKENGIDLEVIIKTPQVKLEQPKQSKNIAPQIRSFVMVSSGKGGVGKSTTTLNLAIATAMQGKKVGLLDADIYGPNIPRMLGIVGLEPEIEGNKIVPFRKFGIEVISMGNLVEEGQSLIWRGAIINRAIIQLLRDVAWSDLDVLFIDMPPGTGDAQLTLAQNVPVTAGICVTTPQTVALDDSRRSLDMFNKLHIPIGGIIENMSGFLCPDNGKIYDIFGKGTAKDLAEEYNTKVLAEIPLDIELRKAGDEGKPAVYFYPNSVVAKEYLKAADKLWGEIEDILKKGLASNAAIQPTEGVSACSVR